VLQAGSRSERHKGPKRMGEECVGPQTPLVTGKFGYCREEDREDRGGKLEGKL